MRALKVAIYTLVALAVQELSQTANAITNFKLLTKEPEASSFVAATNTARSTPTNELDASVLPNAIAFGEQSRQQRLEPSSLRGNRSANNAIPCLDQIRKNLPPGWVMRLPSQVCDRINLDGKDSSYSVGVSPSTSEPGLTVSLFTCEEQQPSCLIGSFAVAAKTSVEAQQAFKNHQTAATPITLTNNIQGYLLDGAKQKTTSLFSSVMWEQDDQLYTVRLPVQSRQNLLNRAYSMAHAIPLQSLAVLPEAPIEPVTETAQVDTSTNERIDPEPHNTADTPPSDPASLLESRHPILTTAEQLRQGEVITNLRYRQSFPSGTARDVGLTGQPTLGISWGISDNLEITLDVQTVDNSGPIRQGSFSGQRINPDGTGPNFFQEFTLQAKQRLWQNSLGTQALSGVIAASLGNAGRPYRFNEATNRASSGQNQEVVTSVELPFTITTDNHWQFTLSPKVAFFSEDNALYFNRIPIDNPGSFGTIFGFAGGISYQLNPRILLWGDAFIPLTGNNTINRDTGLPTQSVGFNAGLRYLVNPRLATDLFVSNTLGNTGPLSIVADRDYPALGLGVTYLPGIISANRQYPEHFGSTQQPPPSTPAGFAFLDGGTIPNQQLLLTVQGGGQGLLSAVRYGLLDDLEIGAFLDNIPGTIDESELGFSGKIRFLHQADGDPFTLSAAVTLARSNNVLVNLINDNRNEFEDLGLEKGGFAFSNEKNGELFIVTLSTPMHYQFKAGSAIWLTPTLGFVQRNGLEIAGLSLGGSVPVVKDLDLIAEAGLDLSGKGNAFIDNNRESILPWVVGLRWNPSSVIGISDSNALAGLQFEVYMTNRLGSTPFQSLRVRVDNETTIGVGLMLPLQF